MQATVHLWKPRETEDSESEPRLELQKSESRGELRLIGAEHAESEERAETAEVRGVERGDPSAGRCAGGGAGIRLRQPFLRYN